MSTHSLVSQVSTTGSFSGTPVLEQQPKILEDALQVVKLQGFHMRKCIDSNLVTDALKYASNLLNELRTSTLLPKYYYELYMAIFDELRYLSTCLYDTHLSGKNSLPDLYELVQYVTHIVPRLYLMITVGSVYLRVSKESEDNTEYAPIKEIMKDMLEMARGVQQPTRGLFLRYYLSAVTRDYLPDVKENPRGDVSDSIDFILQNFIEMNKLWVRLQHQGHSRDRQLREQERKELRLLVGTNLVRLSQLEEITLEIYQNSILPSLLEEIVSCRDVIAQEYLLDVIIQAFPDEFHLNCLDMYIAAVARLQPSVNVKQIVIALIDRFSNYASRAREETPKNETAAFTNGIPDDIPLFDVFWDQVTALMEARPEFTIEDIASLLLSSSSLAANCYPERLDYIDRVLGMAQTKIVEARQKDKMATRFGNTEKYFQDMLLGQISAYKSNLLNLLNLPSAKLSVGKDALGKSDKLGGHFTELLFLMPFGIRRNIAHSAMKTMLAASLDCDFCISSLNGVEFILGEICSIIVHDQVDGNLFGSYACRKAAENEIPVENEGPFDWDDAVEEQTMMAKVAHLMNDKTGFLNDRFASNDPLLDGLLKGIIETIRILSQCREYFAEDDNYTPLFPEEVALNHSGVKIGRGLLSPPEIGLNFFLMGSQVANLTSQEEMCYEFFVEAFIVYEESISESRAQFRAIQMIISYLYKTTVFGYENFETLVTKCVVHCSRLLKRADQCRAVMSVSHLFWMDPLIARPEDKPTTRDGNRVLECLQKSLKIADSVMDSAISVGLFVEILEKYLWYFEKRNDAVFYFDKITSQYINSLIELIHNNLLNPPRAVVSRQTSFGGSLSVPAPRSKSQQSNNLNESTAIHFENILKYIQQQQYEEKQSMVDLMPEMSGGFGNNTGRWGGIVIPHFNAATLK